jgi:hypothetical protein
MDTMSDTFMPESFPDTMAYVDYKRLWPPFGVRPGASFNFRKLKLALCSAGACVPMFSSSNYDVLLEAESAGFKSVYWKPLYSDWLSRMIVDEKYRARQYGPRPVILVGATTLDTEGIGALRGAGSSVTALHWSFDHGVIWTANRCVRMGTEFIVEPARRTH